MHRTPLAEFAAKRHAWTAKRLGMSQGALSKAIREGRLIYVLTSADGGISAVEEKPFPSQRRGLLPSDGLQNSSAGTKASGLKVPVHPNSVSQAVR